MHLVRSCSEMYTVLGDTNHQELHENTDKFNVKP